MNAARITTDDLFEPALAQPDARPDAGASDANVVSFPTQTRLQDIVLKMILDGKSYEEIAGTVQRTVDDVRKIARSEWAKSEITKQLSEAEPGAQRDTLQNLVRIQAFDAVQRLSKLMLCGHPPTELGACKLALQYSLPIPTKETPASGAPLPSDPEKIKAEFDQLQAEITRRTQSKPQS